MKFQKRKGNDQKDMAFRMHSNISKQDIPKVQKDNYRHPSKFEKNSKSQKRICWTKNKLHLACART